MSETANPPARAHAIAQIARLALRLSARRCRPSDRAAPSHEDLGGAAAQLPDSRALHARRRADPLEGER